MSEIDNVVAALGDYFHHLSGTNFIRMMDTPRIWGLGFGPEIMPQARARELEFARGIEEIVQKTKYRCDIASLNAPDVDWMRVVVGAIDTCLSQSMGRTRPVQFRFLFGQTPMVPFGEPANYTELKAALVRLVRQRSAHWEQMPEFWFGRFYRLREGVLSALQAKVFGQAIIGADDEKMTWNHAKAIATDGYEALVGGHNLNMDLFRSYPPVHDASALMHGDGAYGVQLFLNQMWTCGTDLLTKEYLELPARSWKNADRDHGAPADPLADPNVQTQMHAAQTALIDLHRSGRQSGTDPVVPPPPPPAPGIRDNDLQTLGEVREPAFPVRLFWERYAGFDEYAEASRVLSLGKYWNGPERSDFQRGSEIMKETLIKGAQRTIMMSQMDLVSAWKKDWRDHLVANWVLEALLDNPNLHVYVVVSPLDAGAGAEGDQYSFGSGAVRTFELMQYYMTHTIDDHPIDDPDGRRAAALARLEIAPLVYTDKVPEDARTEGSTYKWPDLSPEGYTATLKQPPLSDRPPHDGNIGSAARAVINASGYIYDKVPSAPGNHAKIMIIDDEAYVIGSDNLYPGFLSEFDYLVEGVAAVNRMLDDYWTPLWRYSGPFRISPTADGGYTRRLRAQGGPGYFWQDNPPAGARLTRLSICVADVISALQATYDTGPMGGHGGAEGEWTVYDLGNEEYITEVSGKFGMYSGAIQICELRVHTNQRVFEPVGSTDHVTDVQSFDLRGESGEAALSFFGTEFQYPDGKVFISSIGLVLRGG